MEHIEIEQKTYYIVTNKAGAIQDKPLGIISYSKETGWAFKHSDGARAVTTNEMVDIANFLKVLSF